MKVVTPSPANPELLDAVAGILQDEIFNDCNPSEQSTILEGTKEHRV